MNRRRFIQKMLLSVQAMCLMRWAQPAALLAAVGSGEGGNMHYRPLNGRSLREMALRKEHHGQGVFINPVGLPRKGRFWQFLKWKFSPNRFED